ncbi:DUF1573 domain-containing protein [Chitinophaga sp. RAB17]|uniref:DUF1573 domain-containing protein n=1 Tax=Chitinophaga sp. RAB17 TaxID=3233049 RepID=UPI003F9383B1
MRDKLFFVTSFVMLLASIGYFFHKKSVSERIKAASFNPVIFSSREYNLGSVKSDSLYPVNFFFKGDERMQTSRTINFEPSCGCTLLTGNKTKLLQRNVADTLKVILNTQGKKGAFIVEIAVRDTASNIIDNLKILGNAN